MGLNRVPRPERENDPEMGEEEDEDSENEEDSEDESPPPSPGHIRRMALLQAEHDRLERESEGMDVRMEQIKAWAAEMKFHTNAIASEISKINARLAAEKRASASGNGLTTTDVGFATVAAFSVNTEGNVSGSLGELGDNIDRIADEIRRYTEIAGPPPPRNNDREEDEQRVEGSVDLTEKEMEEDDQDDQPPTN